MAQLTLCIPGFTTYLLSLTFHIRSGTQSNISASSESSQHSGGRQDKPCGAAELGDSVPGLGTGPVSGSPLQPPPCPQGPSLVLGALWVSTPQGLWLKGTRGACGTVGDPKGADNGISC